MSTCELRERPPLPHRLVVPAVHPGDMGLVLTVHALEWDGGYGHWALTPANGLRYVLPQGLHDWARQVDTDLRRGLLTLPLVAAFSRQAGGLAVRILSSAQNV
ncbi:hypothetical protein ACLGIH_20315 [Streptomyces sp. HMX87]|uniref:hypothetical protein n=1 Tax=Streptomyces sp. HMX87 TaxID=3390849 RepID=UPI003A836437